MEDSEEHRARSRASTGRSDLATVLFALEVGDRCLQVLGVTAYADGPWTTQQARNLVTAPRRTRRAVPVFVRDRAGQFTASFEAVLADAGIEVVKIPPRCPRANCFAERLVLTELTDRMLIFGERHLREVPAACAAHNNATCGGRIERCNCIRHARNHLSPRWLTAKSSDARSSAG